MADRALVIDGEPGNHEHMHVFFESASWAVTTISHGEVGLTVFGVTALRSVMVDGNEVPT
jgi:hypothetical protein